MTVLTSSVVLINLDNANCPNGRQLGSSAGIQISDEGPGSYVIISPDDFLLALQNLSTNGFVVRNNTNSSVVRTLTSDGSVHIVNPDGVAGNPQISVLNNSSIQKVVSAAYGTDRATQGRLNFIGAGGVGVTVANNGTLNSADITISGSGGAPALANYLITTPYVGLTNAVALSTLTTGLLKNHTGTGVPTIAVAGTDYQAPSANLTAIAGLTPNLGSMIVGTGSTYASRSIGASGTVPVSNGTDWSWSPAAFTNPMTTAGDLIIGGVAGAPTRLGVGTTGQILTVSGGGAPQWAAACAGPSAAATYIVQTADSSLSNEQSLGLLTTGLLKNTVTSVTGVLSTAVAGTDYQAPSANLTALSAVGITKGSVLVANGTALTELAVGTDGQVLTAASGQATGLQWTPGFVNPMTTANDTIVGGSGGSPSRLAAGTANQVLSMNSGGSAIVWSSPVNWSTITATQGVDFGGQTIFHASNLTIGTGDTSIASYAIGLYAATSNANIYMATSTASSLSGSGGVISVNNSNNLTFTNNGGTREVVINPMTAANDLIIGASSGSPTRLGVGTANQVLSVNSGGSAIVWSSPANWSTITATQNVNFGGSSVVNTNSIAIGFGDTSTGSYALSLSAASSNAQIYMGTSTVGSLSGTGLLLSCNSGNSLVITNNAGSQVLLTNPMTTTGDLIVGGSSGAPTRLAIGSANQVLSISSGGVIQWATFGGIVSGKDTFNDTGAVTVTNGSILSTSIIVGTYTGGSPLIPIVITAYNGSFSATGGPGLEFAWIAIA